MTGLREAVGSNGPELGSFLSRGVGGGDRVVPKNPAKGTRGVQAPSYQPVLAVGALEKLLSFPRSCPKGANVHRTGTVATCTLEAKLQGPNQTHYGEEGISPIGAVAGVPGSGTGNTELKKKGRSD